MQRLASGHGMCRMGMPNDSATVDEQGQPANRSASIRAGGNDLPLNFQKEQADRI
jgi:hypothetical protein